MVRTEKKSYIHWFSLPRFQNKDSGLSPRVQSSVKTLCATGTIEVDRCLHLKFLSTLYIYISFEGN